MSTNIKIYLSYAVCLILAWVNGTILSGITDIEDAANIKVSMFWKYIVEPFVWGFLLTILTVYAGIYMLFRFSLKFDNADIDKKVPYFAMWLFIITTVLLLGIGVIRIVFYKYPFELMILE